MASNPVEVEEITGTISAAEEKFEQLRKLAGLLLTPVAFALTYYLCRGLEPVEARKLSAILAAVAVLWITELIPLPVTALLGAVMCIVLGVAPVDKVFAYFADKIVFVFIGSFMLAKAMSVHALDRRIALGFLSIPALGRSNSGILLGLGVVTAFLSMWVSNTATTAMMLPIGLGILAALHRVRVDRNLAQGEMNARNWPFATAMMLMIAYAASIGGIGTPIGSPPNLIGIAQIKTATGADISFARWMTLNFPILLVMFAALFIVLRVLHPQRGGNVGGAEMRQYISIERQKIGRWTPGQFNTLLVFMIAVVLWLLPGILTIALGKQAPATVWVDRYMPESVVAIIAAILLFMLPTSLREAQFTLTWAQGSRIDWGTILLFGGGLALGGLMKDTGVAAAIGEAVKTHSGANSLWSMRGVAFFLGIVISEATSNTAAATMIIPVVLGVCKTAGVDPLPPALGAVLGASYGFMLPVSTPPNAIAYGSGLVPIGRMMRAGIVFDIIGFFIIWGGLRVMCPLVFPER